MTMKQKNTQIAAQIEKEVLGAHLGFAPAILVEG